MRAFISYSHRDRDALDRLHTHLASLRREGRIDAWFDREILAGGEIDEEIERELETCDLFLLLVSPDFLASDYCVESEMRRALERHESGEARVVPIIVEPCDWTSGPLRRLKAVPQDGKPISEWTNANNAYLDVVRELRRILESEEADGTDAAEPAAPAAGSEPPVGARRYRVQRDFDEIDRSAYRDAAFATIRDYFERATAEIDTIEDIRGRFVSYSPASFGCTIVNRARDRSTAHITVHNRSGHTGLGDIFYSFQENAPPNTANGAFNVESDEYELFLSGAMMRFSGRDDEKYMPQEAAEQLWTEFLQQAGVTYE